jgi:hypothetical protein
MTENAEVAVQNVIPDSNSIYSTVFYFIGMNPD